MGKDEIKKNKGSSFFKTLSSVVVFILILVAIYFIFIRWHFFTPNEEQTFTYSRSDLGTIGDLIGGVLNPVLTFITIGLLIWSIRIQGRELVAATEQSERTADALIQTNEIHQENINEQRKIAIVPILAQKLENIVTSIYMTFNETSEIVINREDHGWTVASNLPKISKITVPSLRQLFISYGPQQLAYDEIFSNPETKDLASKALVRKIDSISISAFDVLTICKELRKLGAEEILYRDEINQTIAILEHAYSLADELLVSHPVTVRVDLSTFPAIPPPIMTIINPAEHLKPFTISS